MIESALGMRNIDAIAAASRTERCTSARAISPPRSAPARSASAVRIPATACSPTPTRTGIRTAFWNDMWHYPLMRMIVAARATVCADRRPLRGLPGSGRLPVGGDTLRRSRLRGQVGDPSEPDRARQHDLHSGRGRGGGRGVFSRPCARRRSRARVTLDGRMIDVASVRQAEAIVRKADAIAAAATVA